MIFRFDAQAEVVIISAAIFGPVAMVGVSLALDTGATSSMVRRRPLLRAGYDLSQPFDTVQIATGSRIETLPRLQVQSVAALGHFRDDLVLVVHDLPASPRIDGVLGLDFLRNRRLTLDFSRGEIELV